MTDSSDRDLLDARMDERLQEYGARWRDALAAPVQPDTASAPRRRWLVPVAAAAAVAVVSGGAFALTAGDSADDIASADNPTTSGPASVVSPEPAPCGANDLVAGERRLSAALGTTYLRATLALAPDAAPCVVKGFPLVTLLDHGEVAPVETVDDTTDGHGKRHLVVQDGHPIQVTLAWALAHHCGDIDNDAILLKVSDATVVEVEGFGQTSCSAGEGEQRVRVSPLTQISPAVEAGTVTGTVTMDGGPAIGASIPVTSGGVTFIADTDDGDSAGAGVGIASDGTYEIDLADGIYDIEVTSPELGRQVCHRGVRVTGGTVNQIDISCPIE